MKEVITGVTLHQSLLRKLSPLAESLQSDFVLEKDMLHHQPRISFQGCAPSANQVYTARIVLWSTRLNLPWQVILNSTEVTPRYVLAYHNFCSDYEEEFHGDRPAFSLRHYIRHHWGNRTSLVYWLPVGAKTHFHLMKGGWRLGSGERVLDRADSHVHPCVFKKQLARVLSQLYSDGQEYIEVSRQFTGKVGYTARRLCAKGDEIIVARRYGRQTKDWFVVGDGYRREKHLTLRLSWSAELGAYVLMTAYTGDHCDLEAHQRYALDWKSYRSMVDPDSVYIRKL